MECYLGENKIKNICLNDKFQPLASFGEDFIFKSRISSESVASQSGIIFGYLPLSKQDFHLGNGVDVTRGDEDIDDDQDLIVFSHPKGKVSFSTKYACELVRLYFYKTDIISGRPLTINFTSIEDNSIIVNLVITGTSSKITFTLNLAGQTPKVTTISKDITSYSYFRIDMGFEACMNAQNNFRFIIGAHDYNQPIYLAENVDLAVPLKLSVNWNGALERDKVAIAILSYFKNIEV